MEEEQPVVTQHSIRINGNLLKYTATAGMMPLESATGEVEAKMFYIAYTLDNGGKPAKRPLLFAFNGGPGSAAVWLHLGAIGPRRVALLPNGGMPPPPYHLTDNESTWLDRADLVFIDPIGTGYSEAVKPADSQKYWGVQGDIGSVSDFIRMYLTRNDRWNSPLFLAGESYGTFRAAGLAGALADQGISLNGIVLISTVLNFRFLSFGSEDDEPYVLYLPTYTAAAWYHKKLPASLEAESLNDVLKQSEEWASTTYAKALQQGDNLSTTDRQAALDRLAELTGLPKSYLDDANLRVNDNRFRKELLRDQKRTLGRYDSRFTGIDPDAAGEYETYDPSEATVLPVFTMTFNNYVRTELGYKTDREYKVLAGVPWDFGQRRGYPESASDLRRALAKNPYLKVFVAMGDYDMATPYYSVEYTLSHMDLAPSMQARISTGHYESGHMIYIDTPSRKKLKSDVAAFMKNAGG